MNGKLNSVWGNYILRVGKVYNPDPYNRDQDYQGISIGAEWVG